MLFIFDSKHCKIFIILMFSKFVKNVIYLIKSSMLA